MVLQPILAAVERGRVCRIKIETDKLSNGPIALKIARAAFPRASS
jgi:hypothetical protein